MALLVTLEDKTVALSFFLGEMATYLLVKVMRGDFYYWVRISAFWSSVLASLFERALSKIIMDYR